MQNKRQYLVALDKETYEKLVALANASGRTYGGQIKVMVNSLDYLPHPPDAQPVPVVYQQARQE